MPLFGGFKANFHLLTKKKRGFDNENIGEPICGAYRINKEEFLSNNVDHTKRNTTANVAVTHKQSPLKPARSSGDIVNTSPHPPTNINTRQSMPDIVQPKPVPRVNKNKREQKKLEQQQHEQRKRELAEQKKREKLALQEQQRQEKIKRDREKQEKIEKAKNDKNISKKRAAPQPKMAEPTPPIPKQPSRLPANYSTNTLESSISRSSGPPPYTPKPVTNQKDTTGNTSFVPPPEDPGSWDIISQHREQLNRPATTGGYSKQTHIDLNYNTDLRNKDNSDA